MNPFDSCAVHGAVSAILRISTLFSSSWPLGHQARKFTLTGRTFCGQQKTCHMHSSVNLYPVHVYTNLCTVHPEHGLPKNDNQPSIGEDQKRSQQESILHYRAALAHHHRRTPVHGLQLIFQCLLKKRRIRSPIAF